MHFFYETDTARGWVGPKCRRVSRHNQTRGFIFFKQEHRQGTHITGVMTRQILDTKQEPKYTEPNKTQVDTIKLTRQTTERDTGEDNRAGKIQNNGGTAVAVTETSLELVS